MFRVDISILISSDLTVFFSFTFMEISIRQLENILNTAGCPSPIIVIVIVRLIYSINFFHSYKMFD